MEQVQTYNSAATTIKNAILNAQYEAAKGVNNIQLTLYYSIGRYISQNSRNGKWGTHAIATISQLLKEDMPGLRGYSETNLRLMRSFYEGWAELDPILNSSVKTDKLQHADNKQDTKTGAFKQIYLGELNGYLRLLDDYVRKPHENPSIGIVLCKSADKSYVEYMIQDYDKPMGVATFKTADDMPERFRNALPDIEELKKLITDVV